MASRFSAVSCWRGRGGVVFEVSAEEGCSSPGLCAASFNRKGTSSAGRRPAQRIQSRRRSPDSLHPNEVRCAADFRNLRRKTGSGMEPAMRATPAWRASRATRRPSHGIQTCPVLLDMSSGAAKNLTHFADFPLGAPAPSKRHERNFSKQYFLRDTRKLTPKSVAEAGQRPIPGAARRRPQGEACMWKRMLQLSNGNPKELSADGHRAGANGGPVIVEREEMDARLAEPGAAKVEYAPALLTDFEQIYQSGAVKPPRVSYGVLKVAEMLNSAHLCGMPAESKRAALMMALDAGGAKIEDILQDAIVRQRVLNDYEEARQRDLQNFESAVQEQNRAIQDR